MSCWGRLRLGCCLHDDAHVQHSGADQVNLSFCVHALLLLLGTDAASIGKMGREGC